MFIGERLRALREEKDFSQGEVGKRTGLLRCYISRVEHGYTVPAVETLEKFARALEVRRVSSSAEIAFLACPTFAANESREKKRLEVCGQVFKEVLDIPDGIPKELLNKAECVIVIPSVLKFAIGVGGDFGRGAITCRTGQHFTGHWSAPALFAVEGANIGLQLGGEATDFVLLVMNPKGANSILSSKVKLGADASAAAGPKGRSAAADTDIVMRAEVLSYSRSRGLFAGISLEGEGKVGVPASGRELISLLTKKSPKNESDPVSLRE